MYDAADKVFLITGGVAGIGAGLVEAFLDEGAKHIAILDIDVHGGAAYESELTSKYGPGKVKFYKCDVTTNELIEAYDSVIENFGYIDVVINCAGIMNDRLYQKTVDINVTAVITSSLKAYELMRKDRGGKGGSIVNIASIAAMEPIPLLPVYCATKSAVLLFSVCLGMEPTYSRTGVRVITLCFGCTDTELLSTKADTFDPEIRGVLHQVIKEVPTQKTESAVKGLVEAFRKGASASTWLVTKDRPAKDITETISSAYSTMTQVL